MISLKEEGTLQFGVINHVVMSSGLFILVRDVHS